MSPSGEACRVEVSGRRRQTNRLWLPVDIQTGDARLGYPGRLLPPCLCLDRSSRGRPAAGRWVFVDNPSTRLDMNKTTEPRVFPILIYISVLWRILQLPTPVGAGCCCPLPFNRQGCSSWPPLSPAVVPAWGVLLPGFPPMSPKQFPTALHACISTGGGASGQSSVPVPHEGARLCFFLAFSTLAFAVVDVTRVPPCAHHARRRAVSHNITTHGTRVASACLSAGEGGGTAWCCHQRSCSKTPTTHHPPGLAPGHLSTWTPGHLDTPSAGHPPNNCLALGLARR